MNQKLHQLIAMGELDWDDERHREAYLKAWVKGELPARGVRGEEDKRRSGDPRAVQGETSEREAAARRG
jgi:hypothetical protein